MVIRLPDGTQEFISDREKYKNIIRERLGVGMLAYLEEWIEQEREEAVEQECESCEYAEG